MEINLVRCALVVLPLMAIGALGIALRAPAEWEAVYEGQPLSETIDLVGVPVDCDRGVNYFSAWVDKKVFGYQVLFVEHDLGDNRELIVRKIRERWYMTDPAVKKSAAYCSKHLIGRE